MLPQVCVCYLLLTDAAGVTRVLLGRKKLGLGQGKYVGPGGKLEPGETAAEAIAREVLEEVGLVVDPDSLEQRGLLSYHFPYREAWSQESTVFVCRSWSGEPAASDELDPEWFDLDDVPLDLMWDDARFWLPGVLAGGTVRRSFTFGPDLSSVVGES
ncbi:8-oxo-dGTP diphosphatase [Leifsonia sp. YIM 134122]|uniref:Oxidized purine nucleoside triphosphate hydrolase n=1 Tax=Leifsonia stereocauli TaxID=3134136 RepID=A0ABU9W3D0_9MICO